MKTRAVFQELPLASIQPEGWLRAYLEIQQRGLTGHMEAAGYPFDTRGWGSRRFIPGGAEGWWPYEQVGYWVDGAVRCGHLLGDEALILKAARQIDFVVEHADRDGFMGVPYLKKPLRNNRWPHAVFFRALMAHHSATGRKHVKEAVARHYLSKTSSHSFDREVCNVEAILWAYEQTGDRRLLDHGVEAFEEYNRSFPEADTSVKTMLSPKRGTEHGVTYNEIAKIGAIVYLHTGRRKYLDAVVNAYHKLDRHQMLIDGIPSSCEHLGGKDPLDSHETCDIADYSWSVGYLLMATGRAEYGDKIERACFNAAPGAVKSDFKALQYFSCPNQVVAARGSNHNLYLRGENWMSFRPNPGTECCPGEVNRIMPNFAARMWLSDGRGGLAACLYGPSRVTARVGKPAREVTLVQETRYPFSEEISFQIRCREAVRFPLHLRIPGWCRKARVHINDEPLAMPLKPGTFVTLRRTFHPNDRITLVLPMDLKLSRWPRGGIGLERGPLAYALRIEEDWRVDRTEKRQTRDFPAYNLFPASPWNFALCVDRKNFLDRVEVVERPSSAYPWTLEGAPLELRVPARRVRGWRIERRKQAERVQWGPKGKLEKVLVKGDFAFTPNLPDPKVLKERLGKRVETVTLVPYGCTHLRISVFPRSS